MAEKFNRGGLPRNVDNCQGVKKQWGQSQFLIPMPPDQEDVLSKQGKGGVCCEVLLFTYSPSFPKDHLPR